VLQVTRTSDVREEYINRLSDLQYKRRKNKEEEVIIILLAIMFVEKLTNPNNQSLSFYAPFINEIKNIENAKVVVRKIEDGLDGKGSFAEPIKTFKTVHKKMITVYTTIIPQKPPEIKEKRIKELYERTDHITVSNAISLETNKTLFYKSMKTWNTQRDGKVRKTTFHSNVDRKTVMIDDFFEVNDMKAQFPADTSLPSWDRLNCRCYLIYH
jgi:hypothetical protein